MNVGALVTVTVKSLIGKEHAKAFFVATRSGRPHDRVGGGDLDQSI